MSAMEKINAAQLIAAIQLGGKSRLSILES